jgi:D-arginine dehydrogenase
VDLCASGASCSDIDVAGLHAAYLRRLRRAGGEVRTDSALASAEHGGKCWRARLGDGSEVEADVIVDAAGAWADPVAQACGIAPIRIEPKRRTMVQLRVGRAGMKEMPLVIDAREQFYFKGEGDRTIWLSPHDEINSDPCDCAPEEIDVAVAIDRFEKVVDWGIEAVERRWAGLRSFSPDRIPVYGFDPAARAFFWCAGQGGFGIQTAPAAAKMAAGDAARPGARAYGRRHRSGAVRAGTVPLGRRQNSCERITSRPAVDTVQTRVRSHGTPSR